MATLMQTSRSVAGIGHLPEAVRGHDDGPQIAFILLAYNQEAFVRDAVESLLAQDYGCLEIVLSDDASTDTTFDIMGEIAAAYRGPHKVILRRNVTNLGLINHLVSVIEVTTSEYIIAAAGDDISEAHRASAIARVLESRPCLVCSGYSTIDVTGRPVAHERSDEDMLSGDIRKIAVSTALYVGATAAWHRDLFRMFPPISLQGSYEDLVLGYRAALLGRIEYIPESLVRYRVGGGMTTTRTNWKKAAQRTAAARIFSLQQRLLDTQHFSPDRNDLIKRIENQIKIERALLALSSSPRDFLRLYSWNPRVIWYLSKVAARRSRRLFLSRVKGGEMRHEHGRTT